MRPSKTESDLEFWTKARDYWTQQAEYWFVESAKAKTPEDEQFCAANEKRAQDRIFKSDLAHQETLGEIIVYSGRAKPEWC